MQHAPLTFHLPVRVPDALDIPHQYFATPGTLAAQYGITRPGSMKTKHLIGSVFSAQKFDEVTALMIGKAVKLTTAQLESREYYYDLDLTADGAVSLVGQEPPPAGWMA